MSDEDSQPDDGGLERRDAIRIGGLSAAALVTAGATAVSSAAPASARRNHGLRFHPDGTFKIVQFNDTQDDERIDRRTIELMEKVLDAERPDLVVHNGDLITDGCASPLEMKQAMNNVARPVEERGIPWVITYGNHDEDSTPQTGMDESDMLRFYRSYRHNLNERGPRDVTGTGNMNLLIRSAHGHRDAFNIFLLDSGRYAPSAIDAQGFEGYPTWDWLRMNQVDWYTETSKHIERRARRTLPALMFIHIPLWEHRFMWWGSVDGRTPADHRLGTQRHGIVGERNEAECPGPFNSGMFSAILDRGDVKGVFCGHDHINTYAGNYYGVMLGYAGNTGFGTYGLSGAERNRLRGARVFELTESGPDVTFETRMVFAKDLDIDLTANDQSTDPLPLPWQDQGAYAR